MIAVTINTGTASGHAPVIDLYTPDNPITAGRRIRLVCYSFSRRKPNFTWLRNGRQLESRQQKSHEHDTNDSQRSVPWLGLSPVALIHSPWLAAGVEKNTRRLISSNLIISLLRLGSVLIVGLYRISNTKVRFTPPLNTALNTTREHGLCTRMVWTEPKAYLVKSTDKYGTCEMTVGPTNWKRCGRNGHESNACWKVGIATCWGRGIWGQFHRLCLLWTLHLLAFLCLLLSSCCAWRIWRRGDDVYRRTWRTEFQ